MSDTKISIIVAISENYAIGRNGTMPWHLGSDLKRFKEITTGGVVIMGRKTYESIGRPLPKRVNVVISRNMPETEGVLVFRSIEDALNSPQVKGQNVFILGGGEIYKQMMDKADNLYITEVKTVVDDADTFFPAIDNLKWMEVNRMSYTKDEKNDYDYAFVDYVRF